MSDEKKVIRPAKKDGEKSPLRELAKHLQKYKERVVFRADHVKDEEGYRAVFAAQGASASHMAAATFLDTISKLLVLLKKQVTQFQRTLRSR